MSPQSLRGGVPLFAQAKAKQMDFEGTENGSNVLVCYDVGFKTDKELLKANRGQIISKKGKRE